MVSNVAPRIALAAYRKRWAIECLFGDAKTRGLNLEDTRLTDRRKLDLLMALVALALAWAGRTAAALLGSGQPKRKSHGHLERSCPHRLRPDPTSPTLQSRGRDLRLAQTILQNPQKAESRVVCIR